MDSGLLLVGKGQPACGAGQATTRGGQATPIRQRGQTGLHWTNYQFECLQRNRFWRQKMARALWIEYESSLGDIL